MSYAEVAVDAPVGYDRTLSYSVPPWLELESGQMVWVPLGPRPVQGIVVEVTDRAQVDVVKDVLAPVEPSPLITTVGIELARWISRYYMAPLFNALALMLPPGYENRVRTYIRPASWEGTLPDCTPKQAEALSFLHHSSEVGEKEMIKALGRDGERDLRTLLRKGLVRRRWELPVPRASHRYERYLHPVSADRHDGEAPTLRNAPKQAALYNSLTLSECPVPLSPMAKEYGTGAVSGLVAKGLAALEWIRVDREPASQRRRDPENGTQIVLTPEQEAALAPIIAALEGAPGANGPFLLHGVTGSGKTEVYLRALEACARMGKKGIFLVPEISLTPQALHRVNTRFPGRVAVLHSHLSPGERFDQWWRIRHGAYEVVVGPRSALFSPLPDLGLVVMDEEHEWTYKQQEAMPHYHTRDVALKIAQLTGAVVVMGSATPDVGTYFSAKNEQYKLLELPRRIPRSSGGGNGASGLARVEVCDMRQELKEGNRSIFSRALASALKQCTNRGEQAVLFLNRRGSATVVQCRDCGHALRCRRCSVALTFHAAYMRLLCHHCNRRSVPPARCPQCRSPQIRYLGLGTQRVMEELRKLLPSVTSLRWDRDTALAPLAHERIIERFLRGDAQVLIGTQMVAKGLDVPGVTLVGVILADIGLNLPDFRSGERTFQLLCQVAGRAGRGSSPGRVIIQSYNPDHYAVEAAAAQDYDLFYDQEIRFRHQQGNPPFSRLVHMTYRHTNSDVCQREAESLGRTLRRRASALGLTDVEIVGPAPAYHERIRGRYRWHVTLRGWNLHDYLADLTIPQGWTLDVDPVTVL